MVKIAITLAVFFGQKEMKRSPKILSLVAVLVILVRDRRYCSSPFRFSLQRCPSSGYVKPDFLSPAASPINHKKEDKNYETIALASVDAKEQCSPTSVLDPPFEEDDQADGHECKDDDDDEDCDLECSYALVQRAQQQLLYKLRRFEKLAELNPIELEKLMLDADDNDDLVEEEEYQDSDLISEEKFEIKSLNCGRECKRFDSWQEVTSNTIDMMLELDLRSEFDEWNKFQKQREETAIDFAFSIFGLLVKELGEELSSLSCISWEPQ
ncbi:uncharacterized protein [Nicotiana tomentosiformis]|uniref:uncharacterized protein n=1 Tax=Nicotiana tomentosiformis TaxID=4098 RepID=UPI00051B4E29|nr:uncharacterized protein LOC104087985 [Nicotiana tomentosiformis]